MADDMKKIAGLVTGLLLTYTSLLNGETYYVRSNAPPGGDGLSDATALNGLNSFPTLKPGDTVRYKRGSSWTGCLTVDGQSGTEGKEITFTDYGDPADPAPFINGNGAAMGVNLRNSSHIVFEKFRISNFRVDPQTGEALEPNAAGEGTSFANNRRHGVTIEAIWSGEISNVTFRHNVINHVYGTMDKGSGIYGGGSGLIIRGNGNRDASKKGRFNGLYILDNHIHDCVRNGVWGNYNYGRQQRPHYYHQNVVFKRNLIERVPGDGLVVWGCEGALIEHNILRDFTPLTYHGGNAAIALWTIMSKDCVFQHNQVTGHRAEHDGQAFDCDFDSKGHVFQYNYSANNIGGVALFIGGVNQLGLVDPSTQNTTFRYNLSINDGFRVHSGHPAFSNWCYAFHFSGEVKNTWIYNNTFYLPPKPPSVAKKLLDFGTWPNGRVQNSFIYNNVFFGTEEMELKAGRSENTKLNSNLYYRISKPSIEANYIQGVANKANDYDLLLSDPCAKGAIGASIGDGKAIEKDFFGNTALPNGLGAYSGESGETITMPARLVEAKATLEIKQKLTGVRIDIINLLHKKVTETHDVGSLEKNDTFSHDMSSLPEGIYYFLVRASELGDERLAVKFVKVDPYSLSKPSAE